ncbi:MAG: hypothetical protein J0M24_24380 [Verrucomicrobia bacterium]|nr:hypothetical protein [Verrucomicrobiota bacterium]
MNSTVTLNHALSVCCGKPIQGIPTRSPERDRAYRRALRAAELAAWHAADPTAITRISPPITRDRTESTLFVALAGAALAALVLGTTGALDWIGDFDVLTRWLHALRS